MLEQYSSISTVLQYIVAYAAGGYGTYVVSRWKGYSNRTHWGYVLILGIFAPAVVALFQDPPPQAFKVEPE